MPSAAECCCPFQLMSEAALWDRNPAGMALSCSCSMLSSVTCLWLLLVKKEKSERGERRWRKKREEEEEKDKSPT